MLNLGVKNDNNNKVRGEVVSGVVILTQQDL